MAKTHRTSGLQAREIARAFARKIQEGIYHDGDTLPSVRELSTEFDVSRETVRRAFEVLEAAGVVTRRRGAGTTVRWASPETLEQIVTGKPAPERVRSATSLRFETTESTPDKQPIWRDVFRAFEAEHPELPIRLGSRRSWDVADAPLPDVIVAEVDRISRLAKRQCLLNLYPWLSDDPVLEGPLSADLQFNLANPCWAVPVSFNIRAAFINCSEISASDLSRLEDDWSLPTLISWAADVQRQRPDVCPLRLPLPSSLLPGYGIDPMNVVNLDDEMARMPPVLAELQALNQTMVLYADDIFRSDYSMAAYEAFIRGEQLICFFHTFTIPDALSRADFPWSVRLFPGQKNAMAPRNTLVAAVTRESRMPEAAISFLRYLCQPTAQHILARWKNNIPVLREAVRSDAFVAAPPLGLERLVDTLTTTCESDHGLPASFTYANLAVWDEEIVACLDGRSTIEEACAQIGHRSRRLAQGYGIIDVPS